MELVKVKRGDSDTPMKCGCISCRRIVNDISLMYADLDGLPYRSYYCQECVDNIKQGEIEKENSYVSK